MSFTLELILFMLYIALFYPLKKTKDFLNEIYKIKVIFT